MHDAKAHTDECFWIILVASVSRGAQTSARLVGIVNGVGRIILSFTRLHNPCMCKAMLVDSGCHGRNLRVYSHHLSLTLVL